MNTEEYKAAVIALFRSGRATDEHWKEMAEVVLVSSDTYDGVPAIDEEILSNAQSYVVQQLLDDRTIGQVEADNRELRTAITRIRDLLLSTTIDFRPESLLVIRECIEISRGRK